jgi:hypothetical protein
VAAAVIAAAALAAQERPPGAVPRAEANEKPRITLGVLRRDGIVFPFASYDGDWSAPWPEPSNISAIPIGLADVPKKWWGAAGPDAAWTARLADGTSRPLKLVAPVAVQVFCVMRLGLWSDYRGGPFERGEPTVAKDGLAVAGNATLLPIERVPLDSPGARDIVRTITDAFNREEKAASLRFTRWKHPVSDTDRRAVPIELEALYRASETTHRGSWTTMYVEAVRKFPPGPQDEGCGLITYARGWVRTRADREPDVDLSARVTYCDRADASFMMPFGRLVLRDEVYWVYQLSSWRDELYAVSRTTPKEVRPVVLVSGGLCYQ